MLLHTFSPRQLPSLWTTVKRPGGDDEHSLTWGVVRVTRDPTYNPTDTLPSPRKRCNQNTTRQTGCAPNRCSSCYLLDEAITANPSQWDACQSLCRSCVVHLARWSLHQKSLKAPMFHRKSKVTPSCARVLSKEKKQEVTHYRNIYYQMINYPDWWVLPKYLRVMVGYK